MKIPNLHVALVVFLMTSVEAEDLASCLGNSVCGLLQVNARGVSKIPHCNCTTTECPMNWDPFDGKSLTQSISDQYKVSMSSTNAAAECRNELKSFQFCHSAPKQLRICQSDDQLPSYTSRQYFDKFTRQKVHAKDEIFCSCPESFNYLDTRYVFRRTKGPYNVVQINSYCLPVSTWSLIDIKF